MRNRLIIWFVLLLAGFLLGFVPQYSRERATSSALDRTTQQLRTCEAGSRVAHLHDVAALMYLEATRKNYGIAGEYATQFADVAHQLADQTSDNSLKSTIQDLMKSRDAIATELSKGDPAVVNDLQSFLYR